jgi:hypothetical protein
MSGDPSGDDLVQRDLAGPPQYLRDMRLIYNGQPPQTVAQSKLQELWEHDLEKFLARLAAAEKDYRTLAAKGGGDGSGGANAPPGIVEDPGTDAALELIERLLGEAKAEPDSREAERAACEQVCRLQAESFRRIALGCHQALTRIRPAQRIRARRNAIALAAGASRWSRPEEQELGSDLWTAIVLP